MSERRESLFQWLKAFWLIAGLVPYGLWPAVDLAPYLLVVALVPAMGAARRAVVARRAGERFYRGGAFLVLDLINAVIDLSPVAIFLVFGGNGLLDRSAPVEHPTSLVAKGWSGRRIEVRSWRPGESTVTLAVARTRFAKLTVGTPLTVVTRAGAFGWEWIDLARWPKDP